ncbi:Pectate trisaccharide-lyase precursor [Vibrio aerogenes CECT 7868]|uniref:Pectate trisaccharide-lyase n=1 Tax=Vibrio aerogenes CECT 7868 TaxID=1216006 RepID=A0A1M5ZNV8_9VIBR|nr:pectate lyase [Vibrio aerogenes]SHI25583.1 Pectate trisaccharide-lyase precursor [Vibrio aerogenes CECT 7868]
MINLTNNKRNKVRLLTSAVLLALCSAPALASGFHTQNGGTTGGQGGQVVKATTGTQIHEALCSRASSDTPIIIQVEGTINHGNTSKVSGDSCNTADDKIELKDVSNVTLIGVGGGALFDELGIHIRSSSNIIIRNVHVRNVKKSGSPTSNGGDAIGMEKDVHNIWVDHVTLEASGGEKDGYDALFDMKNNTKYVTLSYSILKNSGRGGLVGSSDSDDANGPVTFHHNYYLNINSRTPLLRHATAHSYNNYYNGLISSGMNPRIGGKIKAENNYVKDSKDPLGTFYTNDMGYWDVSGNIWDNITWSSDASKSHPAGPNPTSTTSISIPYSYTADDASCIPSIVLATAGANKGLAVSDGSCGTTSGGSDDNGSDDNGSDDTGSGSDSGSDNSGNDNSGDTSGTNLALSASADGSSKADSNTSYGKAIDGDTSTYWSPKGTTGRLSVKKLNTTISTVKIVELPGTEGTITSWKVVNHDTGDTLASGSSAPGVISFSPVSLGKVDFEVVSAADTPKIAEFEVYQ